jgi:hypothetical protein
MCACGRDDTLNGFFLSDIGLDAGVRGAAEDVVSQTAIPDEEHRNKERRMTVEDKTWKIRNIKGMALKNCRKVDTFLL